MIQLQVLNKILSDKDASIITLNNLTEEYFSNYTQEFKFIKNHLDIYGNIPDSETFLDKFPNFDIIKVTEPLNFLLEELMKDKNKRFLAENYTKIRTLILDNKIDEAMSILNRAAEESSNCVSLQCIDLVKDTSRYNTYLDKLENFNKYFIKTGFKELDDIIGGWDVNEDLVTIVARNGLGKSWALLKCAAEAALQGKKVGIYSGEMSEDAVGYRLDTLIGHVANGALMHGGASIKNQYKQYLDNLNQIIPGTLMILTPKMINGSAGVSALRAFVDKYDLDILFVDQHSLLVDDRKGKTPVEKASNISTDLKLLQTVKRIPIICVCQQNREKIENGTFDTTQLAQSDKIGQDSSCIIFIERKDDLMRLHLVKSRNSGANNTLTYKVDLNTGYFQYIPEGDDQTLIQDSNGNPYTEDEVF